MHVISVRTTCKIIVIVTVLGFALFNYFTLSTSRKTTTFQTTPGHDGEERLTVDKTIGRTDARRKDFKDETESGTSPTKVRATTPVSQSNASYARCLNIGTGVTIYGTIRAGRNYSVFSSTVHNEDSVQYLFDLPLASLAWQRIGFGSIVILVVDKAKRANSEKIKFVLSTLFSLEAVVIVLECHQNYAVMISQVSRLFVPYLVGTGCVEDVRSWYNSYLVTSDADLWPLDGAAYELPADGRTEVLCLNAFCCGDFVHRGRSYTMLPIGNIGMRVKTWRSVVRRWGFVPVSVPEIVTYFSREFGDQATTAIQKGENVGWYMDQRMISVLIADWARREDNAPRIRYVRRDVGRDRIDRSSWRPLVLDEKIDAHVLEAAYRPEIWHRLEALLVLMYDRPLFDWCKKYATTFSMLT